MNVAFSCSLFQIVMHLALRPKIAKRDPHFFESLTQPSYINCQANQFVQIEQVVKHL